MALERVTSGDLFLCIKAPAAGSHTVLLNPSDLYRHRDCLLDRAAHHRLDPRGKNERGCWRCFPPKNNKTQRFTVCACALSDKIKYLHLCRRLSSLNKQGMMWGNTAACWLHMVTAARCIFLTRNMWFEFPKSNQAWKHAYGSLEGSFILHTNKIACLIWAAAFILNIFRDFNPEHIMLISEEDL